MRLRETHFSHNGVDRRKDAATLPAAGIGGAVLACALAQTDAGGLSAGTGASAGSGGCTCGLMGELVVGGPKGTDLADIRAVVAGSP